MKTLIATLTLALAGVSSVQAQMYHPAATRGGVLGAIVGAFVGGHNHDRWAEGALLGGVAGALLGAAVAPQEREYRAPAPGYSQPSPYVQSAPGIPAAPCVQNAPMLQYAPPQVVYVESAPRVVYYVATPPPRVVYLAPRAVIYGSSYYSGPRYHGNRHSGHFSHHRR